MKLCTIQIAITDVLYVMDKDRLDMFYQKERFECIARELLFLIKHPTKRSLSILKNLYSVLKGNYY